MKFKREKEVGQVLFIVEGQKTELAIFLEQVSNVLINKYGLDLKNIRTYYLFDKDPKSNTKKIVK